jgi:uncharacterized protein (DUF2345 family)
VNTAEALAARGGMKLAAENGAMRVGMKTDRIRMNTADTDTDNFSLSERILGSNTDNIFFVE